MSSVLIFLWCPAIVYIPNHKREPTSCTGESKGKACQDDESMPPSFGLLISAFTILLVCRGFEWQKYMVGNGIISVDERLAAVFALALTADCL